MSTQTCALVIVAAFAFYWLVVLAVVAVMAAVHSDPEPDPVDAHFDTAIRDEPTFADLRADWPAWEREVLA